TRPRDGRHQGACPHCRAALAEIRRLWAPLGELARENVTAPSGVRASVMAKVRELPRNAWYAVLTGDRGTTYVAARVVGTVTKMAAEGLPTVALAVGRGQQSPAFDAPRSAAGADVGVAGSHVVIDVHVIVRFGEHIPTLARLLRRRVSEHVVSLIGLTPSEINIAVGDVEAQAASYGD
ncbi:MAG: Asp23/Gls24 family envelope stress response protein, partial [Dermatophilaceae bacterium]